jgi:hypothetical protein
MSYLYDCDATWLQRGIGCCSPVLANCCAHLTAFDAIDTNALTIVAALHIDGATSSLNQHCLCRDLSNAVVDALRLGLNVYPASVAKYLPPLVGGNSRIKTGTQRMLPTSATPAADISSGRC